MARSRIGDKPLAGPNADPVHWRTDVQRDLSDGDVGVRENLVRTCTMAADALSASQIISSHSGNSTPSMGFLF